MAMEWVLGIFQWRPKRKERAKVLIEEMDMLTQVRQAHMEWVCAHQRMDYMSEREEIDYAIYALEAAEKRYTMLLKQAKAMKLKAHNANVFDTYYSYRITG